MVHEPLSGRGLTRLPEQTTRDLNMVTAVCGGCGGEFREPLRHVLEVSERLGQYYCPQCSPERQGRVKRMLAEPEEATEATESTDLTDPAVMPETTAVQDLTSTAPRAEPSDLPAPEA